MANTPSQPATPIVDIKLRIKQYVQLRDKIKEMDDTHKEAMKPYRALLEQLDGTLMQHLQSNNADSIATEAGTVYKSTKRSATIADGQLFWDYVVQNNAWD